MQASKISHDGSVQVYTREIARSFPICLEEHKYAYRMVGDSWRVKKKIPNSTVANTATTLLHRFNLDITVAITKNICDITRTFRPYIGAKDVSI